MWIDGTGLRTGTYQSVTSLHPAGSLIRTSKIFLLRGFELMGISLIEVVRSNADGDTLSRGRGMGS